MTPPAELVWERSRETKRAAAEAGGIQETEAKSGRRLGLKGTKKTQEQLEEETGESPEKSCRDCRRARKQQLERGEVASGRPGNEKVAISTSTPHPFTAEEQSSKLRLPPPALCFLRFMSFQNVTDRDEAFTVKTSPREQLANGQSCRG